MTPMRKEVKEKWVTALRSGEYEQARRQLCDTGYGNNGPSFCCLGVLTDLAVKEGVIRWAGFPGEIGSVAVDSSFAPSVVVDWAGLSDSSYGGSIQLILADMNDGTGIHEQRHSFGEIADWIEKNL